MSETGPYAIWQMPNATKNAIKVACVAEVEALRPAEIAGSAGKYMSIAKGPMAGRRPNTIALRRKVDVMSGDHQLLAVDLNVLRAVAPWCRTERPCGPKIWSPASSIPPSVRPPRTCHRYGRSLWTRNARLREVSALNANGPQLIGSAPQTFECA